MHLSTIEGFGVRKKGSGVEKTDFEHRTFNVERRMAKPLTHGLGPIGRSKLEVERWKLKKKMNECERMIPLPQCLGPPNPEPLSEP